MKNKFLLYNGRIHTQAKTRHRYARLIVNSMAVNSGSVVAVGNQLQHDPEFKSFSKIDLKGRSVIPGLVDAHTHMLFWASNLDNLSLQDQSTLDGCLRKTKSFSAKLQKDDWVFGEGFNPSLTETNPEPIRYLLDQVCGGRPAMIYSKDQHSAWVNSRALELAGIDNSTVDPKGGKIGRLEGGNPSGVLYEGPAQRLVYARIPSPNPKRLQYLYNRALKIAYKRGVTGVHSFDSPNLFPFLIDLAERNKVGLRMNYYPNASMLEALSRSNTTYGTGSDLFRLAGIKIFSDGSLGSQTANCLNAYPNSSGSKGIEVTTVAQMKRQIKQAARLGFPCAIHAIGDQAVANVIDAYETAPKLPPTVRHRIEHMQLMQRKDISRVRKLRLIGSMQPSHCPSDIEISRKYLGKRASNSFLFRTLTDAGVDLAFGSDAPIEPLNPIHGIAAAVRRAKEGSRDVFYGEQRIRASEALYNYTVGPAIAAGEADRRGFLLTGYPADFVVLDQDITRVSPTDIYNTTVLATFLKGQMIFSHPSFKL